MDWVKREAKSRVDSQGHDLETRKNRLERMRGALYILEMSSEEDFNYWINNLSSRDVVLLPYVFDEITSKERKGFVLNKLFNVAKGKSQLFRNSLEACYSQNNFIPLWQLAKFAFQQNEERLTRKWPIDKIHSWNSFLNINKSHSTFIAKEIWSGNKSLREMQETYLVHEGYTFMQDIYLDVFSNAKREIYDEEKDKFIEFFLKSDNINRQKVVTGFIQSGSLNEQEDIARIIYEKIRTHTKKPMLWSEVPEKPRRIFNHWVLQRNIREFFLGVNKDHQRFVYWEKFIPKMEDAIVIKNNNESTILFYFSDVVIMEILGTGAVYIYKRELFKEKFGGLVNMYLESIEKADVQGWPYTEKVLKLTRSKLMERSLTIPGGWLPHYAEWERKFDDYLSQQLNWEVDRDAIVREGENLFTL